jgi:hypothetical protein
MAARINIGVIETPADSVFASVAATWEITMAKTVINTRSFFAVALGAALLTLVPVAPHWSSAKGPSLSIETANARVGRPGTPMSVAGVARRTTRRGYYGAAAGVAVGAAAAGAHYYNNATFGYAPYPPCY